MHMCVHSRTTSLCLVTQGLTMRVFLVRWFNWTVWSHKPSLLIGDTLYVVSLCCCSAGV